MDRNERIEQEIRKTMEKIESAERLPPDPYFHTRLMARLEEKRQRRDLFPALLRPALLAILVAINVVTVAWYLGGAARHAQAGNRQQLIEILADDLSAEYDRGASFFNE